MSGRARLNDQFFTLTGPQQAARKDPYRAYQRFISRYTALTGYETIPISLEQFSRRWSALTDTAQNQLCDLFCRSVWFAVILVKMNQASNPVRIFLSQIDNGLYNTLYCTRKSRP